VFSAAVIDLDEGEDDGTDEYKKAKAAREKKEAELRKLRSEGKVTQPLLALCVESQLFTPRFFRQTCSSAPSFSV
jgi:hypothetical protein